MALSNTFESEIFEDHLRTVEIADTAETVMDGSDRPFELLGEVFGGIDEIAVVGWSSQAPAQAQNLRESLAAGGVDTRVTIGLRPGSRSREKAEAAGFTLEDDNLLTPEQAIGRAGLSLLLIADSALVSDGARLMSHAQPETALGLSHGFLQGYYQAEGENFPADNAIIGVCPKGMGPSVRRLYTQGSGINSSFAVEQGGSFARDMALAWSLGIGSPYTFQTTLENEWRSDIYGERAMLLGGVHGIVEALYTWKREHGAGGEQAYLEVVESLVGPISQTISHEGLFGLFESLPEGEREQFIEAYNAAYPRMRQVTEKIYRDVRSGRELQEVVADNMYGMEMTVVDGTTMWRDGEKVRSSMGDRRFEGLQIDPTVAGIYIAGMMAQVDVLRANGHFWSEVVNESIIEAVDSLNPFMRARGVDYMVDNCSVTARRGSRKWAPTFQAIVLQGVMPIVDGIRQSEEDHDHFTDFLNHDVHQALRVLGQFRPPVDIAVS